MTKKILGSAADQTPIAEVMTNEVFCVSRETSVDRVAALMLERRISGMPVVDELGWPIGVISKTDLLRTHEATAKDGLSLPDYRELHQPRVTVEEVMMPLAYTLRDRDSLARAAAVMAIEGVHRLPVVSEDDRVVGIISASDIARWLAAQSGYIDCNDR
jgi:CBS domain-containing protein